MTGGDDVYEKQRMVLKKNEWAIRAKREEGDDDDELCTVSEERRGSSVV